MRKRPSRRACPGTALSRAVCDRRRGAVNPSGYAESAQHATPCRSVLRTFRSGFLHGAVRSASSAGGPASHLTRLASPKHDAASYPCRGQSRCRHGADRSGHRRSRRRQDRAQEPTGRAPTWGNRPQPAKPSENRRLAAWSRAGARGCIHSGSACVIRAAGAPDKATTAAHVAARHRRRTRPPRPRRRAGGSWP